MKYTVNLIDGVFGKMPLPMWTGISKEEAIERITRIETSKRFEIKTMQLIDLPELVLTEEGNFIRINNIASYYELVVEG